MEPTDLTVKILVEIRDSIRDTNSRLDNAVTGIRDSIRDTNSRLDNAVTGIRDSIRDTNSRLDDAVTGICNSIRDTNSRLDDAVTGIGITNTRIDQTNARLVESEIRLATGIAALGGTLESVRALLMDRLDLRDRVGRCELDIGLLKAHSGLK